MKENSLVIVTGMELPENCYSCRFYYDRLCHALQCSFFNNDGMPREMKGGRLVNCPLKSVVMGEWIFGVTNNIAWMKCSNCCKSQEATGVFAYCPNCGAEMRKEGGDV